MGTKRSAPSVHPSRREQVPSEPRKKRQKSNTHPPAKFQTTHPVNQLKSQIRSHKRLLEKNTDLPADVRVQTERALKSAELELERNEQAKKRNEMIGRYHKIRFFDRKKGMKRLAKAKKEYEACDRMNKPAREALKDRIADAEAEINYAIYYPLDKAYVSLFPRKKEGEDDGDYKPTERKGDPEMWAKIKQCMADGSLDALRYGRLRESQTHHQDVAPPTASGKKTTRTKKQNEKAPAVNNVSGYLPGDEADSESSSDFFE